MFTAPSQFTVANDMTAQVKEAFVKRPRLVERAPGFLRLEVISPVDDSDETWLLTYWRDEASFRAWHHSHHYHDSHKGIPKGLKLVPKSAKLRVDGIEHCFRSRLKELGMSDGRGESATSPDREKAR